jgi:hypothetical protein
MKKIIYEQGLVEAFEEKFEELTKSINTLNDYINSPDGYNSLNRVELEDLVDVVSKIIDYNANVMNDFSEAKDSFRELLESEKEVEQ